MSVAAGEETWRKTTQALAPVMHEPTAPGTYDLYPTYPAAGEVLEGYGALAALVAEGLAEGGVVRIDGYVGVFWEELRAGLGAALEAGGARAKWIDAARGLKDEDEIGRVIAPFLGGDDPLFGTRFTGDLADLFDGARVAELAAETGHGPAIVYGCGAALVEVDGPIGYVDLPKNELQFRARAGTAGNIGSSRALSGGETYKRFYFVDWPALNGHKARLAGQVAWVVDGQRPEAPLAMRGEELRATLARMGRTVLRARPWFEPGPWGGQWCKAHVPQLPEAPNYAWSFELISPENGLLLERDGRMLEVSFDWLMIREGAAVLGESAERFGVEFPIRFDFLDTVDGGNLSVQVHPRPEYIAREFGENFTQDECYYILDCTPGARVNLGFQAGVDPAEFRAAFERSFEKREPLDVEKYVQSLPAAKHDLFLIPNGTIHGSGSGNMVLEISATPYIFTFKLHDWLRPDLSGNLRPLNIARGMKNLYFDLQGERVREELVSRPRVVKEGAGWTIEHLPTHERHFYDVYRFNLEEGMPGGLEIETAGSAHVLSLVEGARVRVETEEGLAMSFNYAETFIVPAAAGNYRLRSEGGRCRVVMSRVR